MSKKPEKKQTGKVNYVWVLAGGYLIYLAYKLFRGAMNGETTQPLFGVAAGIVFVAVACYLLRREWKAYKYGMDHIDDPDSWSDEEAEDEELEELLEASKTDMLEISDGVPEMNQDDEQEDES